jgi:PAS domain S-box-containing protein
MEFEQKKKKLLFGPSTSSSSSRGASDSYVDLCEIFDDQFYPNDVDFSAFFNDLESSMDFSALISDSSSSLTTSRVDAPASGMKDNDLVKIPMPIRMPRISTTMIKAGGQTKTTTQSEVLAECSDDDDVEDKDGKQGRGNSKKRSKVQIDSEDMTLQQMLERRERNREHAKRSRIRKKVLLTSFQDELITAREVNIKLRRIVADRLPNDASRILEECTALESSLLSSLMDHEEDDEGGKKRYLNMQTGTCNVTNDDGKLHARMLVEPDYRLMQSLVVSQQNFVLSDPSLPDNPIVYCSDGFCKLSGYKRNEIIGRNCRFLQGPGTDQAAVDLIRKGVTDGKDISVCLLNYKADGTPFWNQFFVGALRDSDGKVVNFVGVQCEVNVVPVTEIKDRVKRLPIPDI